MGLSLQVGRHEGRGRRGHQDDAAGHVAIGVLHEVAEVPADLARLLPRIDQHAAVDDRTDGVQTELELGDDPEVPSAAAQAPEQLRVLGLAGGEHAAVRGHDPRRQEVVAGEAVLAFEPAAATAQHEAGDTRRGHPAARGRESVLLGRRVELSPGDARLDPDSVADRVHLDPLHRTEVDQDAALDGGVAGDRVATSLDRDRQPVLSRESDDSDHVGVAGGSGDDVGAAVEHGVVDRPFLVVGGTVRGGEDGAGEGCAQRVELDGRPRCHREHVCHGDDGGPGRHRGQCCASQVQEKSRSAVAARSSAGRSWM